ncbi:MAG TPA: hypothetical protein VF738_01290 [Rhodanobacter sp.]
MIDGIANAIREFLHFLPVWLSGWVLSNSGRCVALICTLGRYPHGAAPERDGNRIALAGLGVLPCAVRDCDLRQLRDAIGTRRLATRRPPNGALRTR